jgi:hypothetical protein
MWTNDSRLREYARETERLVSPEFNLSYTIRIVAQESQVIVPRMSYARLLQHEAA